MHTTQIERSLFRAIKMRLSKGKQACIYSYDCDEKCESTLTNGYWHSIIFAASIKFEYILTCPVSTLFNL